MHFGRVMTSVLALAHDLKIAWIVVAFIAIAMVDDLVVCQSPAEILLDGNTML